MPYSTLRLNPRITFGIIVLNGEPFTRYNLRSIYPFAHEIIVVEGASEKAATSATVDGHSVDGTREVLLRFKEEEDPDDKLTIITAEQFGHPKGFWPGDKDQQSQAYAERATGDYLWQVDIDEFYNPADMMWIMGLLREDPSITQVNVPWLNFWGGFDYQVDGLFLQEHYRKLGGGVPRVFKWGPGYRYVKHRPPSIVNAQGMAARDGHLVPGETLASKGIWCYHYSTVFPDSVARKMSYYKQLGWTHLGDLDQWNRKTFSWIDKPFRVHHVSSAISWLKVFRGRHPPQIEMLRNDIHHDKHFVRLRQKKDIEILMRSRKYRWGSYLFRRFGSSFFLRLRPLRPSCPKSSRLSKRLARLEQIVEKSVESLFAPSLENPESHFRERESNAGS